ncbi:MAG: cob(I)yrinic acid a,c-diamide adenosyltransferase [Lachnospiraceae bacterium]|jgi:cob(I)alamin adenosyltransferase|nr:cob(I)yrinic acid a,c-diamide adenosyltransferase [Lachnospiraceae bacterium 28-4]MCI8846288.1 cob(I)yrinic acid a,c-diamide adenosyltransferase [Lachnospiraceae bacterium]
MKRGTIHIYSGDGHGKSPAALGRAVSMACQGKSVVIIQFLKGRGLEDSEFLRRMEPEIKLFRFEKSEGNFAELSIEQQADEIINIKNGLNFAKKVLCTGGCDLLILDEVLRLIDNGIISVEELKGILDMRSDESMDVIMTGTTLSADVCVLADEVTRLATVKGGL